MPCQARNTARFGAVAPETRYVTTTDGVHIAYRVARATTEAVRELRLDVRAGAHTGEVETIDGKIGGLTVTVRARVAALASPSEVLVSRTVKDLVAGAGLVFEDAGEHEIKGVPDRWQLYRVISP